MDPLRRVIRRAFNKVDPDYLYELSGDPEEYQVEVDCLIARIRTTPPDKPEAMIKLVHQVLCYTLHSGILASVLLAEDTEPDQPIVPNSSEGWGNRLIRLSSCYLPTVEERQLGWVIWDELEIHGLRG